MTQDAVGRKASPTKILSETSQIDLDVRFKVHTAIRTRTRVLLLLEPTDIGSLAATSLSIEMALRDQVDLLDAISPLMLNVLAARVRDWSVTFFLRNPDGYRVDEQALFHATFRLGDNDLVHATFDYADAADLPSLLKGAFRARRF